MKLQCNEKYFRQIVKLVVINISKIENVKKTNFWTTMFITPRVECLIEKNIILEFWTERNILKAKFFIKIISHKSPLPNLFIQLTTLTTYF